MTNLGFHQRTEAIIQPGPAEQRMVTGELMRRVSTRVFITRPVTMWQLIVGLSFPRLSFRLIILQYIIIHNFGWWKMLAPVRW